MSPSRQHASESHETYRATHSVRFRDDTLAESKVNNNSVSIVVNQNILRSPGVYTILREKHFLIGQATIFRGLTSGFKSLYTKPIRCMYPSPSEIQAA